MPQSDSGPTLTNITAIGRQAVKFGAIALVVMIVGRTLLSAFTNFWIATHPAPPPPPTMGFGYLPPLSFPQQASDQKPKSYQLQTANGRLPDFGDRAKVFLMPKSNLSLLADQRVREIAAKYYFLYSPQILNAQTYRWTKTQPLQSTLEINPQTFNLSLTTDFKSHPELINSQKQLPTAYDAASRVKAYLSTASLLPKDMATASAQITYLKALGGDLQSAASLSDADYIQVDLNRYPIDSQFPSYTPAGNLGVVHAIVSSSFTGNDSIVDLSYHYYGIDYTQVQTYPLRTPDTAWRLLQGGEGYIARGSVKDTALIRNVSLGYYESPTDQQFFQPIYVFSGDDEFLGYIPALDPKVFSNNLTPQTNSTFNSNQIAPLSK